MNALDLRKSVIDHLNWDARVDASEIMVDVKDSAVKLSGTVSSFAQHQAAQNAALSVRGVATVDNQISIRYPGKMSPGADDTARNVTAALGFDRNINASSINVSARNGTVTLTGSVDALWKKRRARDTASNVRGVSHVVNRLSVVPTEDTTDQSIARNVRGALDRLPGVEPEEITAAVDDGVITLSGRAATPTSSSGAEFAARHTRGVIDVKNKLAVGPKKTKTRGASAQRRDAAPDLLENEVETRC